MHNNNNYTTVITTHTNADFDAIASIVAAQKLYPGAAVVFPGSQEKSLRNFFVNSIVYLLNILDIQHLDSSRVKRLVVVDTRQPDRIGDLKSLLENKELEIHIYDHHPYVESDIQADYEVYRQTGATVTLMTEILKEKGISITPDEATILTLGLYEDTGSFTFASTTQEDHYAAGYLLSKGADLTIVSHIIARELSFEQVGLLNDLLQSTTRYNIRGVDVAVSLVSTEKYVPDFAFLIHKMMKMENLSALFAVGGMGNKIYIVGRSRTSDVDAGAILLPLGGGGHPFAASASIRGKTLAQVENELLDILHKAVRSTKRAKDLMSSPPITVNPEVSCKEANNLLTRYNINALLVTDKKNATEELLGCISRQVLVKAVYLNLEDAPVRDYMSTHLASVNPDAQLPEIQEKIIDRRQRLLPVMEDGRVKGVITRTDILNVLVHESKYKNQPMPDPAREEIHARVRNINRLLFERVPKSLLEMLKEIGETAEKCGYGAYVVGGFVRDLFLFRKNEDIDIVIEGDGIAFARQYAKSKGARIHSHEKFGTAVVIFKDGFKIDVASARMEYYRFPADLPTVEMSSIKLDLYRRDFTINTLAIQLNPPRFGQLIDFFSAQRDIREKVIRILHNLSFVEDPTRVYRAIRFEKRFGFTIGRLTESLLKNVIKTDFFRNLSGRRVFTELRLILEEENPIPAIQRLYEYGLPPILHPSLQADENMFRDLEAVKKVLSWHDLQFMEEKYLRWGVYFLMLTSGIESDSVSEILNKLEIPPRLAPIFMRDRFQGDRILSWMKRKLPDTPFAIFRNLHPLPAEVILYMMAKAKDEDIKRAISLYLTHLRFIKPSVSGRDLMKMGLAPGPKFRKILDSILEAKMNGRLATRNDELNFARNYIS